MTTSSSASGERLAPGPHPPDKIAYTPRQVVEQRGTVLTDYPVARNAAERFYGRRLPLS